VRPQGAAALTRARRVLERLNLLVLDDPLLDAAAQLDGPSLRSLDAIHLAAAQALEAGLESVVTYDVRMTEAATSLGLRVVAPT
jgi:predicted nucleic acid-binding protein